ncbi:formylglycine-generating enzyme family protein [Posidoniimonas polymericola]|uniref:formylglycine-generating enzyme family protein n=1 Tax=Posidoniimonas polymericola TaxID=2528002 RepID=UPI0018D3D83B|nr:SUMF1/EgtB/PvdO family nonheme iron enzyme [Posidoniimonas polymericola]
MSRTLINAVGIGVLLAGANAAAAEHEDYTQEIPGTKVAFPMVAIAGGEYEIGSPDGEPGRRPDEGPRQVVRIEPFWIEAHEVTWAEYRQFMDLCNVFERFDDLGIRQVTDQNRVDAVTAPSKLYEPSFTFTSGEDPELPAVSMKQFAAKQYTKWLSLLTGEFYRLPTEAEWEYACRAGAAGAYSYGDDPSQLDDYAWHTDNSDDETHLVAQKKPNAWGLYDMHGNASEWVLDAYQEDGYAKLPGTPLGFVPATKTYPRVLRGGSAMLAAADARCAARRATNDPELSEYDPNAPNSPWWYASDESQDIGFRVVRPVNPPPREQWTSFWDADVPRIQKIADFRIDKEGRGERGLVDKSLPAAIGQLGPVVSDPQE